MSTVDENADTEQGTGAAVIYQSAVDLEALISSVRVETHGGHDHVHIWSKGTKVGTLVFNAGDGEKVARRLLLEGYQAITGW